MTDVRIDRVLVSAITGVPVYSAEYVPASASPLRIQGRLVISSRFSNQVSYDLVKICFRGTAQSRIGARSAVENFACLMDIRKPEEFKPVLESLKESQPAQHLDFVFEPRFTSNGCASSLANFLPPTLIVSGSTLVTRSSALTDQHVVSGSNQVSYSIDAEFSHKGRLVRRIECPVDLMPCFRELPFTAVRITTSPSQIDAKPKAMSRLTHRRQPKVQIHLLSSPARPSNTFGSISIPLAISIEAEQDQEVEFFEGLSCSMEEQWYSQTVFSVVPSGSRATVKNQANSIMTERRTATQKRKVNFPPLWQHGVTDDKNHNLALYTSVVGLEFHVPNTILLPSITTSLLSNSYALELNLKINAGPSIPQYHTQIRIPVRIQAFGSEYVRRGLDNAPEDCYHVDDDTLIFTTTPPPYIRQEA